MYWIKAGGPLMYPILLCSVISLAVAIERFLYLKTQESGCFDKIKDRVLKHVEKNEIKEAVLLLNTSRSSASKVVKDTLVYFYKANNPTTNALEEKARESSLGQLPLLERNVWVLALVANIATLLGLLGTVIGMIITFKSVSEGGIGDPTVLMSSISVALVTTAGGLFVAIPTIVFHHCINRRVDTVVNEMEKATAELLNIFRR